jgi:hypothetical protein
VPDTEVQLDIRKAFKNLQTDSGNRIAELLGDVAVKNAVIEQLATENDELRARLAELEAAMESATAAKTDRPSDRPSDRHLSDRPSDRHPSASAPDGPRRPRPQVVKMPEAETLEDDVEVVGLDA